MFIWFSAETLFVLPSLNRAQKKLAEVAAWENTKRAVIEAKLKKLEVITRRVQIWEILISNLLLPIFWLALETLLFVRTQMNPPCRKVYSYKSLICSIIPYVLKIGNPPCEQEELEKKKADHAEKMKNKVALIHKEAQEKRAMVEARRGEEMLKAEELAAKYRATGTAPKKLGCLGC